MLSAFAFALLSCVVKKLVLYALIESNLQMQIVDTMFVHADNRLPHAGNHNDVSPNTRGSGNVGARKEKVDGRESGMSDILRGSTSVKEAKVGGAGSQRSQRRTGGAFRAEKRRNKIVTELRWAFL